MTRILVVEDSPTQAQELTFILESAGFEVETAPDAAQGLERLARQRFELVLSDLNLPGASGFDLCRHIKADEDLSGIPVVLLTQWADPANVLRGLEAGADGFITKGREPEEIIRRLRRALERRVRPGSPDVKEQSCVDYLGQKFQVGAEREQLLEVLLSAFEDQVQLDKRRQEELILRKRAEEELEQRVLARTAELAAANRDLQSLLDAAPLGVWVAEDPECKRVTGNRYADELMGIPHGTNISRAAPPDQRVHLQVRQAGKEIPAEEWPLQYATSHGDAVLNSELEVVLGNGQIITLMGNAVPLFDETHKVKGGIAAFTDITERKRAEERIKEQAALIDRATNAILVRDLEGRIIFWNQGAERLYGWTAAEAMGQYRIEGPLPELEEARKKVFETGEWTGQLRQVTKAGKEIIVESHWTLLRDDQGQPKSKLVINTDITEQKKHEVRYLRAQRMESIGTLAGGIAHDLNNVLSPILMAIELLRMKATDQASRSFLSMLETSAQRGADMVKQVLSFARGVDGQRAPLRLKYVIRDLVKMLKHTLPKSIDVQTLLPEDLWTVCADATQLHQVLMNLCVNARDAMPDGGQLTITAENRSLDANFARVHVEAKPGPYVLLLVADTGTGIPADVLDKIFDPFFTTKELGKGTGLGLSTVAGIVKNHGGFITPYSEVGKGTQFAIYLPAIASAQTKAAEETHRQLPVGDGELILVVDDEFAIREITKATLEAHGYRVMTADDGAAALSLYIQHSGEIQAVVIDMMMPVMDGPTTLRGLKELDCRAPIIGVSGLAANGKAAEVAGLGAQKFLPKPLTAERLLTTLRELLPRRTQSSNPALLAARNGSHQRNDNPLISGARPS